MTLLGPFTRAGLADLLETRAIPTGSLPPGPVEPPSDASARFEPASEADARRLDIARFLTRMLLGNSHEIIPHLSRVEAVIEELVVVWSPALHTASRSELVTAIVDRDDAITEIDVEITAEAIGGLRVFIEWRVEGRFANAGFLDDDILVEPSNSVLRTVGVLVCTFGRDGVSRIACFYDGVALLQQVLGPGAGDDGKGRHR